MRILSQSIAFLKLLCFCSVSLFCIQCSSPSPEASIQYINGYWEIEKVRLQDGSEKQYNVNQNIDFFEITDTIGIRKKMQPKFDGHFNTSKANITFSYRIENDSLRLYFKSAMDAWRETVVLAKEKQLILKNDTGNLYFYKPYQKLDL